MKRCTPFQGAAKCEEAMESFVYSVNATVPIFLVMIVGGILRKLNIIDEHFANVANKFVFVVTLPLMVFSDLSTADFRTEFEPKFVIYCMAVTLISIFGIWALTELFMKEEDSKGSFVQGAYRSSAAILGMAFIKNMYQDTGMAPLMIIAAVPFYNIFAVIILTIKAKGNKGKVNFRKTFTNILKNPIIIGIFAGVLFSVLGIRLPQILTKTVNMIGDTTTPLALICIGATFEGRKAIKKLVPTCIATAVKLVILPALFIPIAILLGFRNQEMMAIVIMLGSPTTISSYIMAKNMNNDAVLSSSIIVMTTVLSSFTLTGIIFILRLGGYV